MISGKSEIWWAKKRFKLRKFAARLKGMARKTRGSVFRAGWSLRGAVGLALIITAVNVALLFVKITGKLVILPFEIHTHQTLSSDLGSAFAESIADRLNDFRRLFPAAGVQNRERMDQSDNSFDITESFMADLPLVNIPRLSPLNKGSMTLEALMIGPISIPINQIIFENLAFFHKDTLRGTIEIFDDQITARLSLGSEESIIVSLPKDQGYRKLIDRISVELLERKKWISPIPMNPPALQLFAEGLEAYRNYAKFGEEPFLLVARRRYEEALNVDRNADLVRLHLATTQYLSWDEETIRGAVNNFSALRGSAAFERQAKIGHAAAELRLIDRAPGCTRKYQLMESTLHEIGSWTDQEFEEVVMQADAYRMADTYLLPTNICHGVLSKIIQNETFERLADQAKESFARARELLVSDKLFTADQKQRYLMWIGLEETYLLDDRADFVIVNKKGDEELFARAAVEAGVALAKNKSHLTDVQKHSFAPFLAGSNAEEYLRLALATRNPSTEREKFVIEAISLLRKTITEGNEQAAKWAMLRIADIELSRNDVHDGLEWMNGFFDLVSSDTVPFFKLIDERAFAAGIIIEKPQMRCEAIKLFGKADVSYSIFGHLLTADAYRRAGDLKMAAQRLADLDDTQTHVTQWLGPLLSAKIALAHAKLDAMTGGDKSDVGVLKEIKKNPAKYQTTPTLMADAYELGLLRHDTEVLTLLKDVAKLYTPFIRELIQVKHALPACRTNG